VAASHIWAPDMRTEMSLMYPMLIGRPGAGKGTQGLLLARRLRLPLVSGGDLVRELAAGDDPLARSVRRTIAVGEIIPDRLSADLVIRRLRQPDCRRGAVLDGCVRTAGQAILMDEEIGLGGPGICPVIILAVPAELAVARLLVRRSAPAEGLRPDGQLDAYRTSAVRRGHGSRRHQRCDDVPETIRTRQLVYERKTLPAVRYYQRSGRAVEIDGNGPVRQIHRNVLRSVLTRLF
jgi:adenylate kinase